MDTSDIIMLTIMGIFLLFVLLGAFLYERMTPEEKKKVGRGRAAAKIPKETKPALFLV